VNGAPASVSPASVSPSSAVPLAAPPDAPVLLFDGECNFCNATVLFVVDRDPAAVIRFAALQSGAAARALTAAGADAAAEQRDLDTVVLLEGGRMHVRSTAALRVARRLAWPWPLLYYAFILVPAPVRDLAYRLVARNRYRWWGRSAECRVPTPELRARILD
jgi:predicted DCC family thiol-disulfide oxidoreductase YuxK